MHPQEVLLVLGRTGRQKVKVHAGRRHIQCLHTQKQLGGACVMLINLGEAAVGTACATPAKGFCPSLPPVQSLTVE